MPFFQRCLLIVFILVFVISAIILFKWYIETSNSEKQQQQLSNDVNKENDSQEKDSSIDFSKLKEINSDKVYDLLNKSWENRKEISEREYNIAMKEKEKVYDRQAIDTRYFF